MYNNQYNQLNIAGGVPALAAPPPAFTPIALPPDNHSHQLHLSGGYGFTPTTRGTFKVAYAEARQDDAFPTGAAVPLAPGIGNNLEAKVDTTLAQAGIVSRPMPKLTLRADLRYEDRDDKTPVRAATSPPPAQRPPRARNEPRSIRTTKGKAEASYLLPDAVPPDRRHRLRGEEAQHLRRARSSATARRPRKRPTGSSCGARCRKPDRRVSYIYSDRDGSPFVTTTQTSGAPAATSSRRSTSPTASATRCACRRTGRRSIR